MQSSAVLVLRLVAEGRHFCSGFNIGRVGAARTMPASASKRSRLRSSGHGR